MPTYPWTIGQQVVRAWTLQDIIVFPWRWPHCANTRFPPPTGARLCTATDTRRVPFVFFSESVVYVSVVGQSPLGTCCFRFVRRDPYGRRCTSSVPNTENPLSIVVFIDYNNRSPIAIYNNHYCRRTWVAADHRLLQRSSYDRWVIHRHWMVRPSALDRIRRTRVGETCRRHPCATHLHLRVGVVCDRHHHTSGRRLADGLWAGNCPGGFHGIKVAHKVGHGIWQTCGFSLKLMARLLSALVRVHLNTICFKMSFRAGTLIRLFSQRLV